MRFTNKSIHSIKFICINKTKAHCQSLQVQWISAPPGDKFHKRLNSNGGFHLLCWGDGAVYLLSVKEILCLQLFFIENPDIFDERKIK